MYARGIDRVSMANGRPRVRLATGSCVLAMLVAVLPAPTAAQEGAGTTAGAVLQLTTGARASGLSGAYSASADDADVIFYNPAGLAPLTGAASLAYQRHVQGISVGSLAGAVRLGPLTAAAGIAYLDAGAIEEIVPDDDFGGERGRATGQTLSATESAARLAVALPLLRDRASVGIGLGIASSDLAGIGRSATFIDVGARAVLHPAAAIAASLRNLGGSMARTGEMEAPLPAEARVGLALGLAREGLGARVLVDVISRLEEGSTGFAAGLEGGLAPASPDGIGAVARVGLDAASGGEGLAGLRLGAGVSRGPFGVDYAFQNLEFFGAVHRIGLRWTRGATP